MSASTLTLPKASDQERSQFAKGIAVGLVAASIGALYTVFARWGMARGLSTPDLTVLRFGVAGILMLPVLILALRQDRTRFSQLWRVWRAPV
jgi:drug/metabolite transporter (DMT)-like permease